MKKLILTLLPIKNLFWPQASRDQQHHKIIDGHQIQKEVLSNQRSQYELLGYKSDAGTRAVLLGSLTTEDVLRISENNGYNMEDRSSEQGFSVFCSFFDKLVVSWDTTGLIYVVNLLLKGVWYRCVNGCIWTYSHLVDSHPTLCYCCSTCL